MRESYSFVENKHTSQKIGDLAYMNVIILINVREGPWRQFKAI